jgi:hypothetical protein
MTFNVVALVALENAAKVAAASFTAGGVVYGLTRSSTSPGHAKSNAGIPGMYSSSRCTLKR